MAGVQVWTRAQAAADHPSETARVPRVPGVFDVLATGRMCASLVLSTRMFHTSHDYNRWCPNFLSHFWLPKIGSTGMSGLRISVIGGLRPTWADRLHRVGERQYRYA